MIIFKISPTLNRDMEAWFWILGWSLSALTIFGNGFIIFLVDSKRHLRTKTNAFVVSLAVADLFVGMSVVPSLFFCEMATGCSSEGWSAWVHMLRWLFEHASMTNLCSLVLDRYIAVVKPLKYLIFMKRGRVVQMICLSWTISVVVIFSHALNLLFYKKTIFDHIVVWMVVIFLQLLPCFILIFCFASMLYVVCKHDRAARSLAKQLRFNHRVLIKNQEKSAIILMAIVVGLFLLCYGVFLRCSFLILLKNRTRCNDVKYKIPILVLNSAVNPLAYGLFKRDIKNEIKRRFSGFAVVKDRNKIKPRHDNNCFKLERQS